MRMPRRMGTSLLGRLDGARVEVTREGMADGAGATVGDEVGKDEGDDDRGGLLGAGSVRGEGRGVLRME